MNETLLRQAMAKEILSIPMDDGVIVKTAEWISVDNKLPEIDKRVLLYVDDYHIDRYDTKSNKILFGYLRKSGRIIPDGCLGDFNVTYWMPLPEPPK